MKRAFFAVMFSALTINACPDISGNYTCGYNQDTGEPNILQIQQLDPITYKIKSFGSGEVLTYTANGQLINLDDETYSRTFLTVCPTGSNSLQFTAMTSHRFENWTQKIGATYLKTATNKIDFIIVQDVSKKDSDTHFSVSYHCKQN